MTSSGRRAEMEYGFLRRFRHRRLLAFLRREHLYATFDALGGETRLFLNARTLQAMVAHCRWEEARRYVRRFLPRRRIGVEARTILRFIAYLSAVDDVAQGRRPGNEFAGDHLEREFDADASSNTMDCADFVRKISHKRSSFPGRWDSVEWQFLRVQAALTVKELVMNTPEFSHLLRLPRCRRKRQRKIIGRMPASLLARCFLPKERSPSPRKQGIPGAPVVPCIGRNCGLSSANLVTEHLSQEDCHSESVASTEHSPTTGELCPDIVGASSGDMDHMHKKVNALQKISNDMIKLLTNRCTFGPDHNALVGKMLEQEAVLHEMRLDCLKAIIRGGIQPPKAVLPSAPPS